MADGNGLKFFMSFRFLAGPGNRADDPAQHTAHSHCENPMTHAYPDYKSLRFDRPAEQVLRITMARGKMNAMDFDFHHAMTTIWQHIEDCLLYTSPSPRDS